MSEVLIVKINILIWFHCMKKKSPMDDKKENNTMVAIRCFVWALVVTVVRVVSE